MTEFRDDMLTRSERSINVSNPVLEQQAQDPNHKLFTCGKEAIMLPEETITIRKVAL